MENFIQLQHKELEVRVIESKERQENIKANKEIAFKSIDAQQENAKIDAQTYISLTKINRISGIVLFVILGLIICVAIFKDKEEIALEIVKALIIFIAGFAGGMYKGAKNQEAKQQSEKQNQNE